MTCKNCDPKLNFPGRLVKYRKNTNGKVCFVCGDSLLDTNATIANYKWDTYFHSICIAVSIKSPCLSRKIGAILVRDHSIVSTGFNGPSRGIPHCGEDRFARDGIVAKLFSDVVNMQNVTTQRIRFNKECPRHILGYASGTYMELCPAQHAEENAVSNAARLGVSTVNTILYMNSIIPCKNCFGTLINAGISKIVIDKVESYDIHTQYLIDNSSIKIRRFEL